MKAQEEKERATPKGPQASAGELASGEDGDQSQWSNEFSIEDDDVR